MSNHSDSGPPLHKPALSREGRMSCARFRFAWGSGNRPKIEEYLSSVADTERAVLLRRLVRLDVLYRRRQGEDPKADDYAAWVPPLDDTWLSSQLCGPLSSPGDPAATSTHAGPPTLPEPRSVPETPLRCPQCHNPLRSDATREGEMICDGCGASFRLERAELETTLDEQRVVGRFYLLHRVGAGSFGEVWRARDLQLGRDVALKVPHAPTFASPDHRERFEREIRAAAQLRHPGIVRLYEVATLNGLPALVSDFIEGVTLKELLDIRRLTFREAATMLAEVADALEYAHSTGLIHRDIKPGNIMMETGPAPASGEKKPLTGPDRVVFPGKPIIVDFGLALREEAEVIITHEGQVVGTPAYMSPEQAAGRVHAVDRRSDVYSLGVVLYQLLCGELPFRGSKPMMLHQVMREEPRPPRQLNDRIPRDLETICLKAMSKEPSRRYQRARDVAEELRRYLRGEPILARPPSAVERLARLCWRNFAVSLMAATIAALLLGGFAVSSYWAIRASRGERWAIQERENAERATEEARSEADKAAAATTLALTEKRKGDHRLYAAQMNLAWQAWEQAKIDLVQRTLEQPHDTTDDPRGFEWYYLDRLCRLDLRTMRGHADGDRCVAFSPNGRLVASASRDHTVRLWDTATGDGVAVIPCGDRIVYRLAFRPDGGQLAGAASDGSIQLWDDPVGKPEVRTLPGHAGTVHSVAYSPDGHWLVSGGEDGSVRLWDSAAGTTVRTLGRHPRMVRDVAFSPDGSEVASVGGDQRLRVWDPSAPKEIVTLEAGANAVAYSPDGRYLACDSSVKRIAVWDRKAKRFVRTLYGHTNAVRGLAFSPDSRRVASASDDHTVRVWDVETGEELLNLRGHTARALGVAFHRDGWRLASASEDGTVKIWDADRTAEMDTWSNPSGPAYAVAFRPGVRCLAYACSNSTVVVGDPDTGEVKQILRGHKRGVHALAYSPDGKRLVSGGGNGLVIVWNAETGKRMLDFNPHADTVVAIAVSPNGRLVASASKDKTICLWNLETKQVVQKITEGDAHVQKLIFSPDSSRLYYATGGYGQNGQPLPGEVRVRDIGSEKDVGTLLRQTTIHRIALAPDGKRLAVTGTDDAVAIWDVESREKITSLRGHSTRVLAIAFSPDGRRLATGGYDHSVKIWSLDSEQQVLTLDGHTHAISDVAFSLDGKQLASADFDGHVLFWDGEPLTAQILAIREARAFLRSLEAKALRHKDLLAQIRDDLTVSDAVRQTCLDILAKRQSAGPGL